MQVLDFLAAVRAHVGEDPVAALGYAHLPATCDDELAGARALRSAARRSRSFSETMCSRGMTRTC